MFLNNSFYYLQISCESGNEELYGDVLIKAKRLAIGLKEKFNLNRNDVVTLCTNNHMNDMTVWIAVQFLCGILSTIDAATSTDDMKILLKRATPKIIFSISDSVNKIEEAVKYNDIDVKIIVLDIKIDEYLSFDTFIRPLDSVQQENDFLPEKCENIKDTALIVYSSGSTGLPKGICLSHYGILCQTDLKESLYFSTCTNYLTFSTLYWISTISLMLGNIRFGYTRYLTRNFSVKKFWSIVKDFNVIIVYLWGGNAQTFN